jgi:hypothetical protein
MAWGAVVKVRVTRTVPTSRVTTPGGAEPTREAHQTACWRDMVFGIAGLGMAAVADGAEASGRPSPSRPSSRRDVRSRTTA